MGLLELVRPLTRTFSGRARRIWANQERVHLELRHLGPAELERFAAHLEDALTALEAVEWIEINGHLGRVVVAFDQVALPLADLLAAVEAVEEGFGLGERDFPSEDETHPGDIEPLLREAAKLGADAVSVALSLPLRFAFPIAGGVRTVAGSAAAVVNGVPRVRGLIESRFPSPVTDVGLAALNTLVQGLGHGPLGPLTELVHHLSTFTELQASRAAWAAREPELFAKPDQATLPTVAPPRPGPLPDGPVERFADAAWVASLAAAGAVLISSRNLARAGTALEAGLPKAARYGRDAFVSTIGRALAERGVVVLHRQALRVLDRVDCLVLQGDLLLTDHLVPAEVAMVGDTDPGEARRVIRSLIDPDRPTAVVGRDGWKLGPLDRLPVEMSARTRRRADTLGGPGGPVLGLARGKRLIALVQMRAALRPEAEDLVALARAGNLEVVFALSPDAPVIPLEADRVLPEGEALGDAIRDLQREGRVVCVVAGAASSEGLRAADCGIGVHEVGTPAPWAADVLCRAGLLDAAFVVEACAGARAASQWSARTATLGASLAAFLAFRPLPGAGLRAGTAINGAALVTMAGGTRSALALAHRPRALPRDPTPWHALEPAAVLQRIGSSPQGLAPGEAARRLPVRTMELAAPFRLVRDVLDELVNPLTPILAVGAGLSLVTGAPADAAMVGGVVALNAVIGGVQRFRAEEAFAALSRTGARQATVRRLGLDSVIDADFLVPGDVLRLRAGDAVPADCRILTADWLEVDESSLTGESLPIGKDANPVFALALSDRTSMLYDGSSIAAGDATAVVVATGAATEARRAGAAAQDAPVTGVEARLQRLTALTIPVAIGSGAVTVAVGLLRRQPAAELVAGAVSLAVAAVPEGLPLLASVAQLSAARRLAHHGILVRNARAIEALGRVQVMCVDKTGTVTEGRLRLVEVAVPGAIEPLDGLSERGAGVLRAGLRATPEVTPARPLPHPTDAAVAEGAERAGVDVTSGDGRWERIDEMPFEPGRGYHATLGATGHGLVLAVKGAPEIVLPRCSSWAQGTSAHSLDEEARAGIAHDLDGLTRSGLRVLCVAERAASQRRDLDDDRIRGLAYLGLLAIADPVRPAAAAAVRDLRAAGVSVVMITGDHPSTAEGIAAELGLLNGHPHITGPELDELDDDELAARLLGVPVFARVTPAHKVRIVRALQTAGKVVAMTGDGANDAPAIRLADVGIALGERSTSAARDAADLIVLDDRIEVLVDAVAEGRGMWVSVRDAVALLVGGNLGEIGFTVGGALLGGRAPLNPRQLLLVNLLTDVVPAMAIAVQPPARRSFTELLREGPEASLGSALDQAIVWRAVCTGSAATGAWMVARATGPPGRARTVALAGLVGAQLGQTLVAGRPSPATVASILASGAVLAMVVQTPGLSQLFGCTPLDPLGWGTAAAASAAATGVSVVIPKMLARRGAEQDQLR